MNIMIKPLENTCSFDGELKDSYAGYGVFVSETSNVKHYHSAFIDDKLCIVFGSVYENSELDCASYVQSVVKKDKSVFDIDGSFLYFEIGQDRKIEVFSEREGLIPLYYRMYNSDIVLSTKCDAIFGVFQLKR